MNNKNIKIVELPASVLSQISGGDKKPTTPPPPPPKTDPKLIVVDPTFQIVWEWD